MKQKKNINIIVGTNNAGKLREIKDLLPKNLIIYSPKELKLKSPKENGKSFKENSLIKAKFFSKKAKMICLADDSGLEINILSKKPGIFSSRWAGSKGNFNFAIKKVFNRFYTERPENEEFGKHSGLGLSISKQIIEAHNGEILVENRINSKRNVYGARVIIILDQIS